MAKFKVGDQVVAQKNAPYRIATNGWKGIVVKLYGGGEIRVEGKNGYFGVNEKYFDLAEDTRKVVITVKGKETIATLYENNATVRKGIAKCSPDDKFDFEIGAKLAFERLFPERLAVGDFVRIVGNSKPSHRFKIGQLCEVRKTGQQYAYLYGPGACKAITQYVACEDFKKVDFSFGEFKKEKMAVAATKDSFDSFIGFAANHGLTFGDKKFNPFLDSEFSHVVCLLRLGFIPVNGHAADEDELFITVESGKLKVGTAVPNDFKVFKW